MSPVFQRKYLRQTLGQSYLHDTLVSNTTASCGADVNAYAMDSRQADASLLGGDATTYQRSYLRVNGMDLRVASFNCASGTYVTAQMMGTFVPAGAEYEVHELLSPADKDRAVDGTVRRLTTRQEFPIPTVGGTKFYALDPRVVRVLDAYYYADPGSGVDRGKRRLAWFGTRATGSGNEIRIEPALPDNQQIVLDAVLTLTLGPADTDVIDLPSEEWVLRGAEARCWDMLCKHAPGTETAQYRANRSAAVVAFNRQSALHAPQIDSKLGFDDPI